MPSSNVAVAPQTNQEEHDDQQWQIAQQEDIDNMDQLPFTDDVEPDFQGDEFHDCGTWSDDETGGVVTHGII